MRWSCCLIRSRSLAVEGIARKHVTALAAVELHQDAATVPLVVEVVEQADGLRAKLLSFAGAARDGLPASRPQSQQRAWARERSARSIRCGTPSAPGAAHAVAPEDVGTVHSAHGRGIPQRQQSRRARLRHDDRYGAGSTVITSQLPVEAWHEVIGEPTFADAILDRIVHNAYRLANPPNGALKHPAPHWSQSIGTSGRDGSVRAVAIAGMRSPQHQKRHKSATDHQTARVFVFLRQTTDRRNLLRRDQILAHSGNERLVFGGYRLSPSLSTSGRQPPKMTLSGRRHRHCAIAGMTRLLPLDSKHELFQPNIPNACRTKVQNNLVTWKVFERRHKLCDDMEIRVGHNMLGDGIHGL